MIRRKLDKPWPFKHTIINGKRYTNVVKRVTMKERLVDCQEALF